MINLEEVWYRYPDAENPSLKGINFCAAPGEVVGVVGANGAGKTTLAKVLSGFLPHAEGGELEGAIHVGDMNLRNLELPDVVARVGLIVQNPFNQLSGAKHTVEGEIAFGLENLGCPRAEMRKRVSAIADELGIAGLLGLSPFDLSGGQQQLVALASILVMEPPAVVMDEPTAQLDPAGSRRVFELLDGLKAAGRSVVIFERKLELLSERADRILVLDEGRIVAGGNPQLILGDESLQRLGIGATRYTLAARAARLRGLTGDQELPVSLGQAVRYFRRRRESDA